MQEWTDEKIQEWIYDKCWLYHEEHPGGLGCFIKNDNLSKDDPPLARITENVISLQGQGIVTADIERGFTGNEDEHQIYGIFHLKLTPKGIEKREK